MALKSVESGNISGRGKAIIGVVTALGIGLPMVSDMEKSAEHRKAMATLQNSIVDTRNTITIDGVTPSEEATLTRLEFLEKMLNGETNPGKVEAIQEQLEALRKELGQSAIFTVTSSAP